MAEIFPFRGVRYSEELAPHLSELVTQPYDKINQRMQEEYYWRHDYNIVRLIKGKSFPNDDERNNQYTRAREFLDDWLTKGVLVRERTPAIYAYFQEYDVEGKQYIRKGFVALGKLELPGKGVKAHENTLAGPKADRLNLLRATRTQFGHIFMLYKDPAQIITKLLDSATIQKPDMEAEDYYGEVHKLWRITEPDIMKKIQERMKDRELIIADGHHRYETAVNFWLENKEKMAGHEKNMALTPHYECFRNRMMTFINMDDPGLLILPTHRIIHSIQGFKKEEFLENVKQLFDARQFESVEALKEYMEKNKDMHIFGVYFRKEGFWSLTLKKNVNLEKTITGKHSIEYKSLDVTILHSLILERFLGIDKKALEEQRNIVYVRGWENGKQQVDENENYQMIFFLNPTKPDEVHKIAMMGERMPQKSTDFYPKLLTGLVINVLTCFD